MKKEEKKEKKIKESQENRWRSVEKDNEKWSRPRRTGDVAKEELFSCGWRRRTAYRSTS